MVLTLDDKSELRAHEGSDLGYLICLGHLFESRTITNIVSFLIFYQKRLNFLMYIRKQIFLVHLLFIAYIISMVKPKALVLFYNLSLV